MNPFLLNTLLFLAGFVFLTGGAEFLVRGASRFAVRLNVPLVVIGLTIVAFGTSLPELLVSMIANLEGGATADISIGNVVGSNIANLALILGLVAVLRPVSVERKLLFREYPLMLAVSLVFWAMAWDGEINRLEGVLLFLGLIGFTLYSYTSSRTLPADEQAEAMEFVEDVLEASESVTLSAIFRDLGFVLIGIIGLLMGANWLVDSATFMARHFGISELVIGLTVVALGTSLPELATSVVAILRKEGDIALGNLVGSNLFNILAIVGITAMVKPLPAQLAMRTFDFPVMLLISLLPLLLVLRRPHEMNRWNGAVMLSLYLAYNLWILL
ncbi:MAG: calcium/sodium antiporter [Caldilineaceae bacterium]|nr:calcium/sodium antiporter [Caldilineaceae bacterium]HRJ43803.1 calcium/sodium antiporter [Caldilineaceae bacterium]